MHIHTTYSERTEFRTQEMDKALVHLIQNVSSLSFNHSPQSSNKRLSSVYPFPLRLPALFAKAALHGRVLIRAGVIVYVVRCNGVGSRYPPPTKVSPANELRFKLAANFAF